MSLSATTLGTELANMVLVTTEAAAINNFATGWTNYFYNAVVGAVTVTPLSLAGASTAMVGAMTGLSAPNGAAAAIEAGITAFWTAITTPPSAPAAVWITSPALISATAPPTLTSISTNLQPVFDSNKAGDKSLVDAANAVALTLHTDGGLGGIATLGPPPPSGTPTPIL